MSTGPIRFIARQTLPLTVLLLVATPARADGPASMVVDLSTGTGPGASISPMAALNGNVYFQVNTEIWGTDGAQTWVVKDLAPWLGSLPGLQAGDTMVAHGSSLYFFADTTSGTELWQADGTNAGFTLLINFDPNGGEWSACHGVLGGLVFLNDGMLFTETPNCGGSETIDPFDEAVIVSGSSETSFAQVGSYEMLGDELYFVDSYWRLSRSDGTQAGTTELTLDVPDGGDIQDGPDAGCQFAACGHTCVVSCEECSPSNCVPRAGFGFMSPVGESNGLYWIAEDYAAVPNPDNWEFSQNPSLWFTDGGSGGASEVAALPANTGGLAASPVGVFLTGPDTVLSIQGAPAAGTPVVIDDTDGGYVQNIGTLGSTYLFQITDTKTSTLFGTDGTLPGTHALGQWPLARPHLAWAPQGTPFEGGLLFGCADDICWTDGTAANTRMLATTGGSFAQAVVLGDQAFARVGAGWGMDVWVTDGTPGGTHVLSSTETGSGGLVTGPTNIGDVVTFVAQSPDGGSVSYLTDGTAAGTHPGTNPFTPFGAADGVMFFTADAGTGPNLYVGDGSPGGTVPVSPTTSYDATAVLADGDQAYFLVNAGSAQQVWQWGGGDGGAMTLVATLPTTGFQFLGTTPTAVVLANASQVWTLQAGVVQLTHDFGSATGPFGPSTSANGLVFFYFGGMADLYATDGTSQGTVEILQHLDPCNWAGAQWIVPMAGGVVFTFANNAWQVMWTDGHSPAIELTDVGGSTSLVENTDWGCTSAPPYVTTSDLVFFPGTDANGTELWRTDGTFGGTFMVRDIEPGPMGLNPSSLYAVSPQGPVVFQAYDDEHGYELWQSNGTAETTFLTQDIRPGPGSSWVGSFAQTSTMLLFAANDWTHGKQLWSIPLKALTSPSFYLVCPGDVSVSTSNDGPVAVTFPQATPFGDAMGLTVTYAPPEGSEFSVGDTEVTASVDGGSQTATCSFDVMVTDTADGGAVMDAGVETDGGGRRKGATTGVHAPPPSCASTPASVAGLLMVMAALYRRRRR